MHTKFSVECVPCQRPKIAHNRPKRVWLWAQLAEKEGFEPSNRFWRLHDFQSCALVQLGDFSVYQILTFDLQFRADCGRGVSALACNMPAWWIIHETGQYFKQFLKIALPASLKNASAELGSQRGKRRTNTKLVLNTRLFFAILYKHIILFTFF